MKSIIVSIILFFFISCQTENLGKQKVVKMPYWAKNATNLESSSSKNSETPEVDSVISNSVIIELFTGSHPLRNSPMTKKAGIMSVIPYQPYSYLILDFQWEKCEKGWNFLNCELVERKGEMLHLYEVHMDNYDNCNSGIATIEFQLSGQTLLENFKSTPVFYLNEKLIKPNKVPESVTYYQGFNFDIQYHFNSNNLTKNAFFYNVEKGLGNRTGFLPDGIFEVRDLFLSHSNTVAVGDILDDVEQVSSKDLKIAIWDHFGEFEANVVKEVEEVIE